MSEPTLRVLLIFPLVVLLFLVLPPHPAPSRAMRATMIAASSGHVAVLLRKASPPSSDDCPEDIRPAAGTACAEGVCNGVPYTRRDARAPRLAATSDPLSRRAARLRRPGSRPLSRPGPQGRRRRGSHDEGSVRRAGAAHG